MLSFSSFLFHIWKLIVHIKKWQTSQKSILAQLFMIHPSQIFFREVNYDFLE